MQSFTPLEITQAKSILITAILSHNGHEPVKDNSKTIWYYSPLRQENTPSFVVYEETNTFFDFGEGTGGDVVKLTMLLLKTSFVDTVKLLLSSKDFFFISPKPIIKHTPTEKQKPIIESIKPLSNSYFIKYIESRKISIEIAKKHLQEIYYKNKADQKKPFFGIGMINESNGYEVKNCSTGEYYCIGSKDISLINNHYNNISIFEGMFDYLALLTHYKKPIKTNAIILHSIYNIPKILEIPSLNAQKIYLFLDNDTAGNKATQELQEHFTKFFGVTDCRHTYNNYKDFAEKLQSSFE